MVHLAYTRVIVNPVAGASKNGRKWPQIMNLLEDRSCVLSIPASFSLLPAALDILIC